MLPVAANNIDAPVLLSAFGSALASSNAFATADSFMFNADNKTGLTSESGPDTLFGFAPSLSSV